MNTYLRFVRELQRFREAWSVTSSASAPSVAADRAKWRIVSNGPNWRVETDHHCFGRTHCGCLCSSAHVVAPSEFDVPVIGYDPRPWNGLTDYCLCHSDGTVLAVIEAIRPSYLRGFALKRYHK
jgi:hypothetical protein